MGVIRATARSSEMGCLLHVVNSRMSAGWGNPMEVSGLPCGKVGVTAWKFRGYPVENSALPQAAGIAKLLLHMVHLSIVIDEFTHQISPERRVCFSGPDHCAIRCCGRTVRRTAAEKMIFESQSMSAGSCKREYGDEARASTCSMGCRLRRWRCENPTLRRQKRRGDPQDVAYRPWLIRHILRIEK
jgi:hypothetical protein